LRRGSNRGFEILIGNLDEVLGRHAAPSSVVVFWSVLAGGGVAGFELPESGVLLALVSGAALVSVLAPSAAC
jgi:hypothetical protein